MIRVATAPMNWNSDDLPDLRPEIPIGRVLAEMVKAGYEGTEYGTGLPADPRALRAILAPHGLVLASIVETRAEVETLFNVTGAKALGLCVDLGRLMGALHKVNYSGWMVIEQDTSPKPPLETARANRRYLKETFGL